MGFEVVPCNLTRSRFRQQRREDADIILLPYFSLINQGEGTFCQLRLAKRRKREKKMVIVFSAARAAHGLSELLIERRVTVLRRYSKSRADNRAFHCARGLYISLCDFLRRCDGIRIAGAAQNSQQAGAQSFLLVTVTR